MGGNESLYVLLLSILLSINVNIISVYSADNSIFWHYEEEYDQGPSNWWKLEGAELCGSKQQSPIQINPNNFINLNNNCTQPLIWNIDDTQYKFTVTHKGESGHTLLFKNANASLDIDLINSFQYDNNTQHNEYIYHSFHLHWGPNDQSGSEHIFNDIVTTLELHFVHYSSDYLSLGEAVIDYDRLSASEDDDPHTLGVIGFLFEEIDTDNPTLYNEKADEIILSMATDLSMRDLWETITLEAELEFSITDLVNTTDFMQNYYFYYGSLTTPPCTPAVRWHLAQNTISIRKSTMDKFRNETQKWSTTHDEYTIDADRNYRPIQTNPSCIWVCSNDNLTWCPEITEIDIPDWHYEDDLDNGPSDWKYLENGELCGDIQQSPIKIYPDKFTIYNEDAECSNVLIWNVDDTVYNWTVSHKGEHGHTIRAINYDAKHDVYLQNSFQYEDNFQHSKYDFYSFHFHWGVGSKNGSEHVFNNITTTLEIHFVHYSHDYLSIGDAINAYTNLSLSDDPAANDPHTLAVTGFLFEEIDTDDTALYNEKADEILLKFANDERMNQLWEDAVGEAYLSFAITDLVDVDDFTKNYYYYKGSLTTPPCTPAVRWHLAQNPIPVRHSTMNLFRDQTKRWSTASGHVDASSNFRPLQSNPSCIWTCYDGYCYVEDDIDYPDWHYEDDLDDGPSNWYKLPGGELCASEQQSPILINPSKFKTINASGTQCNTSLEWHVDETIYNWTVTHKGEHGHTIKVKSYTAKDDVYLPNIFQYEDSDRHAKYKFDHFHFHWGPDEDSGSEHIFDGYTTTLEVHFVHYSADYLSVGTAVEAWKELYESNEDAHTLAVVGFLFAEINSNNSDEYNVKADNVILQLATDSMMVEVWKNATSEAYIQFPITDLVDIDDLMSNYYHYEGSLTTPPCTPAVSWHLGQNPIIIRHSTMNLFRNKTQEWGIVTGHVDADKNYRPVQLNPSCINTCFDTFCPLEEEIEYPDWHYEDSLENGPSNWHNLEGGELCDNPQQSPILIKPDNFDDIDAICNGSRIVPWHVDDTVYNWTVSHKGEHGHTIKVKSYSAKDDVYLTNIFQSEDSDRHPKYKLDHFHFHWGPSNKNGSEHIFEGIITTLEVHLVHYSSDYLSVAAAVEAWTDLNKSNEDDLTLAVVAFLFQEIDTENITDYNVDADGVILELATNAMMQGVWANAIGEAYLQFSITDLVDPEEFMNHYYSYEGSLTTPPCTPAVRWLLGQDPIIIRHSTMNLFRNKTQEWTTAAGEVDADSNFRPIQSNPSCIKTCSEEYCPVQVDDSGGKTKDKLLPLWIVLGILGALLIAVGIWYWFCYKDKKKGTTRETRVPTSEMPPVLDHSDEDEELIDQTNTQTT